MVLDLRVASPCRRRLPLHARRSSRRWLLATFLSSVASHPPTDAS
jgi:hypothetical protein